MGLEWAEQGAESEDYDPGLESRTRDMLLVVAPADHSLGTPVQ